MDNKMILKLEVTQEREIGIEINRPYYIRHYCHYYLVIPSNANSAYCLEVAPKDVPYINENYVRVKENHDLPYYWGRLIADGEQISETEFWEAYDKIILSIEALTLKKRQNI